MRLAELIYLRTDRDILGRLKLAKTAKTQDNAATERLGYSALLLEKQKERETALNDQCNKY